nr:MAG TPA: hypothetical protein [Caudoviricetes sp.]
MQKYPLLANKLVKQDMLNNIHPKAPTTLSLGSFLLE